jgi:hypothetical protein
MYRHARSLVESALSHTPTPGYLRALSHTPKRGYLSHRWDTAHLRGLSLGLSAWLSTSNDVDNELGWDESDE